MNDRPLTARQQAFVAAYVGAAHGNATQAARMAGYTGSPETLAVTGARTLRDARVAHALSVFRMATAKKGIKTAEEVAEWLCNVMDGEVHEPQPSGCEGPPRLRDRLTACGMYIKVRGMDEPAPVAPAPPEVNPEMERALVRLAQLTDEQWAAFQRGDHEVRRDA